MRQVKELRRRSCCREHHGQRGIVSAGVHAGEPPWLDGYRQAEVWSRVAPQSRLLSCDGPGIQVLRGDHLDDVVVPPARTIAPEPWFIVLTGWLGRQSRVPVDRSPEQRTPNVIIPCGVPGPSAEFSTDMSWRMSVSG
jgi:hypothetical protein